VLTNISPLTTTFIFRNIGNAGKIPNFEPATGLFIDAAFRSRSGIGMGDLADVSSIEVMKGPPSNGFLGRGQHGLGVVGLLPECDFFCMASPTSAIGHGQGRV